MVVSAIISTYNSAKFIESRISNLLNQTLGEDLEIIVVVSGSTQEESKIVEKFLEKYNNIKLIITDKRESIYQAWNRGIKISNGRYICNANTDDILREDALEIMAKELDKYPEVAMVYADQYITNKYSSSFDNSLKRRFNRPEYSKLRFLARYWVGPQPMWRSSLHFNNNLWFDEGLEICGDNDFACKVMEKYELKKVSGILGVYFKPDDFSNKEFQKKDLTLHESNLVRDKYSRRFITSCNDIQKKKLRILSACTKIVPNIVYRTINFLLRKINSRNELIEREYLIYLGSLIAESEDRINKAISYCKPFLNNKNALLLHWQYLNLTNSKDIPIAK